MKNYGLNSEQEAVDGAIVLSKKLKSDVVVYSDINGWAFSDYSNYDRPDSLVDLCFSNGEEVDFPFYQS